jgi:hypothetical protein
MTRGLHVPDLQSLPGRVMLRPLLSLRASRSRNSAIKTGDGHVVIDRLWRVLSQSGDGGSAICAAGTVALRSGRPVANFSVRTTRSGR